MTQREIYIDRPRDTVKEQWLAMWQDYDECPPNESTLNEIWNRLISLDSNTHAFFAYEKDMSKLIGFIHYVLHETTSCTRKRCYLEDGYVLPEYRKNGIALMLYEALKIEAKKDNYQKIYWITRPENVAVNNSSDKIAKKTNWIRYEDTL